MIDKVTESVLLEDEIEEILKNYEKIFDVRIELSTKKVSILLPMMSDKELDSDLVSECHLLALSKLNQIIASQYGLDYKDFLSMLYCSAEASNNQIDLTKANKYMHAKRQEFLNALDTDKQNVDLKDILKK